MRSYNIDEKLKDKEIIREAIVTVCKSKNKKKTGSNGKYILAQHILLNVEEYTEKILNMVVAFEDKKMAEEKGETKEFIVAYKPKRFVSFTVVDGASKKVREIASVPLFPDQIIHQLIITASQSVMIKGMYEYSCGSIPKRGIHKGKRYLEKAIKQHRKHDKSEIKYVAKLDISKCYPSISHDYLKEMLRKKFNGKLFLWLAFSVIDSYHAKIINDKRYGLPIGYSTSQWWCNFVLTPLDHFVKNELRIKHYVRYIDDLVFFGRNKKELHKNVRSIMVFIQSAGFKIKDNWQVFRFDYFDKSGKRRGRDIDFLGFRFFRDKIILRKRMSLATARAARKIYKSRRVSAARAMSFMSRIGWLKHCNSHNFYKKYIKQINLKELKGVIADESRKHCNAYNLTRNRSDRRYCAHKIF